MRAVRAKETSSNRHRRKYKKIQSLCSSSGWEVRFGNSLHVKEGRNRNNQMFDPYFSKLGWCTSSIRVPWELVPIAGAWGLTPDPQNRSLYSTKSPRWRVGNESLRSALADYTKCLGGGEESRVDQGGEGQKAASPMMHCREWGSF